MNDKQFQDLLEMSAALTRKFPAGNDPFQIATRILEEAGEVATEINHLESSGIKLQKHGTPDKADLAKEIRDLLGATIQLAQYYDVLSEVGEAIDERHKKLKQDGF